MKRAALSLALLLLPFPVLAQAYSCRVPERIELPPPPQPDGPVRRKAIGSYTLALSWSPEYCRGAEGRNPANMQCNKRNGRFGFVLHGLWPEAVKGAPPQWCAPARRLSVEDYRANLCRTPLPRLIEHEWAKHGTCMAQNPARYFMTAGNLFDRLRLPDGDGLSRRRNLTAGDLRLAFTNNNPGWRPEAVGLLVSDSGWLREMRLCMDKAFKPRRCPRASFGPPDTAPLKIWRGL